MSCESEIAHAVRDRGSRYTVQRAKILGALRHAGAHVSADEVLERVRASDPHAEISLSTVYRTLEHAASLGLATGLRGASGAAVYEWNEPGARHHHLRCSVCGRVEEVDLAALGAVERELREGHAFEADIRHLEIPGRCTSCR